MYFFFVSLKCIMMNLSFLLVYEALNTIKYSFVKQCNFRVFYADVPSLSSVFHQGAPANRQDLTTAAD